MPGNAMEYGVMAQPSLDPRVKIVMERYGLSQRMAEVYLSQDPTSAAPRSEDSIGPRPMGNSPPSDVTSANTEQHRLVARRDAMMAQREAEYMKDLASRQELVGRRDALMAKHEISPLQAMASRGLDGAANEMAFGIQPFTTNYEVRKMPPGHKTRRPGRDMSNEPWVPQTAAERAAMDADNARLREMQMPPLYVGKKVK